MQEKRLKFPKLDKLNPPTSSSESESGNLIKSKKAFKRPNANLGKEASEFVKSKVA